MSKFLDFAELKELVSFSQAIDLLGLQMKQSGAQWRGACPTCKGSDRSLVVTEGRGFFCFTKHAGGDVIAFAAHIRDCSTKEAAQFLADAINHSSPTVPQKEVSADEMKGFTALTYLENDHDADRLRYRVLQRARHRLRRQRHPARYRRHPLQGRRRNTARLPGN
jgi:DNA primase